jgi:hypothetical protein
LLAISEKMQKYVLLIWTQGSLINISELSEVPIFTADMLNEKIKSTMILFL